MLPMSFETHETPAQRIHTGSRQQLPLDEFHAYLLPKTFRIGYSRYSRPAGLSTMLNWRVFSYLEAVNGIYEAGDDL